MAKKIGRSSWLLERDPVILSHAAIGSKKEGEGPLGAYFDRIEYDASFGEASWEKAESRLIQDTVDEALKKASLQADEIELSFAGDLLNQCVGSSFGLRALEIPFLGLYGACSTMAESLFMAGAFVEGGFTSRVLAATSSHFCSAERQFRFPLQYGGQRTPTAQWTATASGALIVGDKPLPTQTHPVYLRALTAGTIVDLGITDANNMGAAMAPAAAHTLKAFFRDSKRSPDRFDRIVTGDLGLVGSKLLCELLEREGLSIAKNHDDCGLMLYDRDTQDVHAGGSGCGCSASVLCGNLLTRMEQGALSDILFVATGALLSPTITQQGESIPGIAHLIWLSTTPARKGGA